MNKNALLLLVGAKIREIRKNKGWSQEKLGEKAGFHFSYIGRIERGTKNISLTVLGQIADALEVGIHQFFGYTYEYDKLSEKDEDIRETIDLLINMESQDVRKVKNIIRELL